MCCSSKVGPSSVMTWMPLLLTIPDSQLFQSQRRDVALQRLRRSEATSLRGNQFYQSFQSAAARVRSVNEELCFVHEIAARLAGVRLVSLAVRIEQIVRELSTR